MGSITCQCGKRASGEYLDNVTRKPICWDCFLDQRMPRFADELDFPQTRSNEMPTPITHQYIADHTFPGGGYQTGMFFIELPSGFCARIPDAESMADAIVRAIARHAADVVGRTREEIKLTCMDCPVYLIQELTDGCDPDERNSWGAVEGAWFTHAEAERFANSIHYRLGTWRVYAAMGARGKLKKIMDAHTQE